MQVKCLGQLVSVGCYYIIIIIVTIIIIISIFSMPTLFSDSFYSCGRKSPSPAPDKPSREKACFSQWLHQKL